MRQVSKTGRTLNVTRHGSGVHQPPKHEIFLIIGDSLDDTVLRNGGQGWKSMGVVALSSIPWVACVRERIASSHPSGEPASAEVWNPFPSSSRAISIETRARITTGCAHTVVASMRRLYSRRIMFLISEDSSEDRPTRSTCRKSSFRIRCQASPLDAHIR